MGIVHTLTKQLSGASTNTIAHSQTPGAAGNLTLTASPVSLDTARRVLFTPAGAEGANGTVWTVYGTNGSNNNIQETVTGVDNPSTVATQQDFKTVSRIAVNKAQAGAVIVGTNGVGSTDWQSVDLMREPVNVNFQVVVSGTVNYTIEYTSQDVNALGVGAYPTVFAHSTVASQSTSQSGSFTDPIAYLRLTVNSGTGSATLTYEQAGP